MFITYLPEESVYEQSYLPINEYDVYRKNKKKKLIELEKKFRNLKYNYYDSQSNFIILRDPALASILNLSIDDSGEVFSF
jgi:hypothetical protein